jgi:hypothetical protein
MIYLYLTGVHPTSVHLMGVSHGRAPYRRHLHLIGMHLTAVHLFRPKHQQSCLPTEIDLLSNQLTRWLWGQPTPHHT